MDIWCSGNNIDDWSRLLLLMKLYLARSSYLMYLLLLFVQMNTDNTKNIQKLLLVIAVLKHPHNSKKNIKSFFRKKYNLGRQKDFYRNLLSWSFSKLFSCLRVMKKMMMNCFCGMINQPKALSIISSRDQCQRS